VTSHTLHMRVEPVSPPMASSTNNCAPSNVSNHTRICTVFETHTDLQTTLQTARERLEVCEEVQSSVMKRDKRRVIFSLKLHDVIYGWPPSTVSQTQIMLIPVNKLEEGKMLNETYIKAKASEKLKASCWHNQVFMNVYNGSLGLNK